MNEQKTFVKVKVKVKKETEKAVNLSRQNAAKKNQEC
jgi:hypothetical protein